MKRRQFIQSMSATAVSAGLPLTTFEPAAAGKPTDHAVKRKIFAAGSGSWAPFAKYVIGLTGKENPRICLIPTASGDGAAGITSWYKACEGLPVTPFVMKAFISSYNMTVSFEETLMGMDAVFVSGGNTLNMIAVWKAQGIDQALRKAYEAGVVMAGGSAGSLCWFQKGTTDSRPIRLSVVEGLGWIKTSHSPHFDAEASRRPLYHEMIRSGEMNAGYACDNLSGIYFENEEFVKAVSLNEKSKSYYVKLSNGQIDEKELPIEIIH